jgi:hypothetical protein
MRYEDFLATVIEQGIEAAMASYESDPPKRRGSVAGFRACEGKTPAQLDRLLKDARLATASAYRDNVHVDEYWEMRCYEAEIQWVCNCVSAALANQDLPTIVTPTCRGAQKAAAILGTTKMTQEGL